MTTEKNSDFFEQVFAVVRKIPIGRVTSYGAIAKYLSSPKSSRVVGYAMNGSHGKNIPAHRVVNRIGMLSGKAQFTSPTEMQERLEAEGVVIKNDQVVDFKGLFWGPMEELPFLEEKIK
ncbi:MAG: methylated-DNA-protein-cysteine methyltransferase-like protein [Sphingobacteriales bacterium]|jgi:methylated-DNA-protein-cysteine methyltransferase-like protein